MTDSVLHTVGAARALLEVPARRDSAWPVLSAALLAATSALLLAGAVILGPGVQAPAATAQAQVEPEASQPVSPTEVVTDDGFQTLIGEG